MWNSIFYLHDQEILYLILTYLNEIDISNLSYCIDLSYLLKRNMINVGFNNKFIKQIIKRNYIISGEFLYKCLTDYKNIKGTEMKILKIPSYKRLKVKIMFRNNIIIYIIRYKHIEDLNTLMLPTNYIFFNGEKITNHMICRKTIFQKLLSSIL